MKASHTSKLQLVNKQLKKSAYPFNHINNISKYSLAHLNNKFNISCTRLKLNSRNHHPFGDKDDNNDNDDTKTKNLPNTLVLNHNHNNNDSITNRDTNSKTIKITTRNPLSGIGNKTSESPYFKKYKVIFNYNNKKPNLNQNDDTNSNSRSQSIKGYIPNNNNNNNDNKSISDSSMSEDSDNITIKPIQNPKKAKDKDKGKDKDKDKGIVKDIPLLNPSKGNSPLEHKSKAISKEDYIINNLIRITKYLRKSPPNINGSASIDNNSYSKLNEYKPLREIMRNSNCNSILSNDYYSPKYKDLSTYSLSMNRKRQQNNRYDINEYSNATNIIQLRDWMKKKKEMNAKGYYSNISPIKSKDKMSQSQSQSFWKENEQRQRQHQNQHMLNAPFKCISNNYLKHLLVLHRSQIKKINK